MSTKINEHIRVADAIGVATASIDTIQVIVFEDGADRSVACVLESSDTADASEFGLAAELVAAMRSSGRTWGTDDRLPDVVIMRLCRGGEPARGGFRAAMVQVHGCWIVDRAFPAAPGIVGAELRRGIRVE